MLDFTSQLTFDTTFYTLAALHCLIGSTAAAVATYKGRKLGRWLGIGLVGGTPALIAALLLPAKT